VTRRELEAQVAAGGSTVARDLHAQKGQREVRVGARGVELDGLQGKPLLCSGYIVEEGGEVVDSL
jgi:hypothetical protein